MSTHLPTVSLGAPHYHFMVTVRPTGDTEIDKGVGRVLGRQHGVFAVTSQPGLRGTVVYDVAVSREYSNGIGLIQKHTAEALEEYYSGEGVSASVLVGSGIL